MIKHLYILTLILVASCVQTNKTPENKESANTEIVTNQISIVPNEFRYLGNALVCTREHPTDDGYLPCLNIGGIKIGDSISTVEKKYPDIFKTITNPDTSITKVYPVEGPTDEVPYFAVVYKKNLVSSIQLTGRGTKETLSFSSIQLGDQYKKVLEIIGPPSKKNNVQEINGEIWSYFPFPISIEIVENKVYSIKVYNNRN